MPAKQYKVSRVQMQAFDPDSGNALAVLLFWWVGILVAAFAFRIWWLLITGPIAIGLYIWWLRGLHEDWERLLAKGTLVEATVSAINYIPRDTYQDRLYYVEPEVVVTYVFNDKDYEVYLKPDSGWVREYARIGQTVDLVVNPKHPDQPVIVTTFAELVNTNGDKQ